MIEFLLFLLQSETSDKAQSLICMGLSKLLLSGIVTDERVRQDVSFDERPALNQLKGAARSRSCLSLSGDSYKS